jgi:hypothetical protein
MATINYWGLTGIKDSVTVALTITVDQLITAIASDESLPTDYYRISLLNNPAVNDVVYGDSSTTLTAMGIVDGDTVLCTTRQVDSKQVRQIQKLEIAEVKRKAGGDTSKVYYRTLNSYDTNLLPNPYNGNVPEPDDGASTLTDGRPWTLSSLVTTNLVLNLDPDDATSYSGSGTTWTDIAGTAQNITLVGSPTYTSGTPSYFTFNGTSQYGSGASTGVIASTVYTKSAWFYLNGYQDNNIFSGDGHFIYMGPSASVDKKIYCGHSDWGSFTAFPSTATINLSTWYNVTLTFSTTNGMSLYINGALDSTYTAQKTAHPGTGTASIAAYVTGNLLKGRVGKVLAYNAELSAAQVLQNFNATKAIYGL